MRDWNGREIPSARSKGGVTVVAHPFNNLISTGCIPWPTPEVLQKLYQSRQIRAFQGNQLSICESGIGYYCDLQSLHSEDAMTWSVFGTVSRSKMSRREAWVADFLKLLDISDASPVNADIFLWRRIPHPETLVSGGPEIDFGIITNNALILGEAKWQSGVGKAQGKKKDKDQIQLRGEFLKHYGMRLFPSLTVQAVVGLSLFEDTFTKTVPDGVSFRTAVWKDVCLLGSHPHSEEVERYYNWKNKHTKLANNIVERPRYTSMRTSTTEVF